MDPRPLSQATSSLVFMSRVAETALATHAVVTSARNKTAGSKREVTINKVTVPVAGIATNRSTLPHLHYSLQGLMMDLDNSDILPFLYAELLLQLAEPRARVPK